MLRTKADLKVKETIMVAPRTMRTNYFRGEDIIQAIEGHGDEVEKIFRAFAIDIDNRSKITDFLSKYVSLY